MVQSPVVSGKMERNWHKLMVISVRFVIMSPALSLDTSKCALRSGTSLCRAITRYNKSSD